MSDSPIFVVTHPRACSTAFERVFMTRKNLQCLHEPFGDAFYYGPERLGERYENDEFGRQASGFKDTTYATVVEQIETEATKSINSWRGATEDPEPVKECRHDVDCADQLEFGRRLFIKDMAYYLMAPEGRPTKISPSLWKRRGIGTDSSHEDDARPRHNVDVAAEPGNPTVIPSEVLSTFKFAFLIRHPSRGIPSFLRCTRPPLSQVTGWSTFDASEAGYRELRVFFNYVCGKKGLYTTNEISGGENSTRKDRESRTSASKEQIKKEVCVIDADDLLDNPSSVVQAFCRRVGLSFDPDMLKWETREDQKIAETAFEKWKGWHEDALRSKGLTPREHAKPLKERDEENAEWLNKFGADGVQTIRDAVDANVQDYEYLKQFAWDPKRDPI